MVDTQPKKANVMAGNLFGGKAGRNSLIGRTVRKWWSWHWAIKVVMVVGLGVGVWQGVAAGMAKQASKITYQTATARVGTLVTSISGTGTITSGNYSNIETKASGTVKEVYVTNGDRVIKGQKIALVDLDDYAKERQSAAWVAYLNAKEAQLQAVADKPQADIEMWQARQAVLDAQEAYDDMVDDNTNPTTHEAYTEGEKMVIIKTLDQKQKAFSVAESKYLNADADIANANTKAAAALRDYQENSAIIVAPAAGMVSDLALAPGLLVNSSSTTSSTSGATIVSAQTVGKINDTSGQLIASVSLSELDVVKVKAKQKVALTLDAYEDKGFTGMVLAVDTSGSVNSGVTGYTVTILLDPVEVEVYPNMAVSAEIITEIKSDVVLVPSSAVVTGSDGVGMVQVKKNENISTVEVKVGSSNDTDTEIVSGLNEGDEVVTATVGTNSTSSSVGTSSFSSSPFSGIGRSTTGGSSSRGTNIRFGGPGF